MIQSITGLIIALFALAIIGAGFYMSYHSQDPGYAWGGFFAGIILLGEAYSLLQK